MGLFVLLMSVGNKCGSNSEADAGGCVEKTGWSQSTLDNPNCAVHGGYCSSSQFLAICDGRFDS